MTFRGIRTNPKIRIAKGGGQWKSRCGRSAAGQNTAVQLNRVGGALFEPHKTYESEVKFSNGNG